MSCVVDCECLNNEHDDHDDIVVVFGAVATVSIIVVVLETSLVIIQPTSHHVSQHCLVPRKYNADPKLAVWVETQRILWNRDYRQLAQGARAVKTEEETLDADTKDNESQRNKKKESELSVAARMNFHLSSTAHFVSATLPDNNVGADALVGDIPANDFDNEDSLDRKPSAMTLQTAPGDSSSLIEAMSDNSMLQDDDSYDDIASIDISPTFAPYNVDESSIVDPLALDDSIEETDDTAMADTSTDTASRENAASVPAVDGKRLTLERKAKLDALGFVWSPRSKRGDEHWVSSATARIRCRTLPSICLSLTLDFSTISIFHFPSFVLTTLIS
jgi:hypothetical protein